MRVGRLLPVAILLALGLTLFTLGFEWFRVANTNLPEWLLWLVFFLASFAVLYLTAYLTITRRVRRIQDRMEENGLANMPIKKNKTLTLPELEEVVMQWSTRQSKVVEELQSREQFRRDYMGNVSHELKTPIFNIQGYVLTLLDGAMDDPKVAHRFLKRAAKSVDRMTQLIKDLDVLNKVESGQYDMKFRHIPLHALIDDTMQGLEGFIERRHAKVRVDWKVDKDIVVNCDVSKINQVMDNLVVNAVKYSEDGELVTILLEEQGDKVLISIKDRGVGIPESDLARIFERFYRVDKARSREAGGSGLGLSIVKHIIDKHGESIAVESKIGVGTTFKFTLARA
ncbi:MAG: hypothetical protein RL754_2 [Bacteroidota bacterium]|jgi:two-component system phosphate regulon sensor histidine kinase PhoR